MPSHTVNTFNEAIAEGQEFSIAVNLALGEYIAKRAKWLEQIEDCHPLPLFQKGFWIRKDRTLRKIAEARALLELNPESVRMDRVKQLVAETKNAYHHGTFYRFLEHIYHYCYEKPYSLARISHLIAHQVEAFVQKGRLHRDYFFDHCYRPKKVPDTMAEMIFSTSPEILGVKITDKLRGTCFDLYNPVRFYDLSAVAEQLFEQPLGQVNRTLLPILMQECSSWVMVEHRRLSCFHYVYIHTADPFLFWLLRSELEIYDGVCVKYIKPQLDHTGAGFMAEFVNRLLETKREASPALQSDVATDLDFPNIYHYHAPLHVPCRSHKKGPVNWIFR